MSKQRKTENPIAALVGLLIFLVTLAAFLPSLKNDFVKLDDDITFYENPHLQQLNLSNLRWMFTDVAYSMRYKPLSWLVYALVGSATALKPQDFHALALLFHGLNAALFYFILRRLLKAGFQGDIAENVLTISAALGALLWAVHPLRVEPVARATDLTYCQSLFFTLASLCCQLRAIELRGQAGRWRSWYAAAVISFAAAMLSYPFVAGYALVLVILDFYPLRRFNHGRDWWRDETARRIWAEKIPFCLLSSLIFLTFLGRLNPTGVWAAQSARAGLGLLGKGMQAFYIWSYYLWKPWVPIHLSPIYTTLVSFDPLSPPFLASALVVAALTALLAWQWRKWPLALALWICHLILLVPALGLTEHPHYPSDRYSYVAGLLWPALIAAGCVKAGRWPKVFFSTATALLALVLMLGALSFQQTKIWRDTPTLFNYVIAQLGEDPYRADIYMRLGVYYSESGRPEEAIRQLQEAVRIRPEFGFARSFLGVTLMENGRTGEAADQFEILARADPGNAGAHANLGFALLKEAKDVEAISGFQSAVRLDPDQPLTQETLGVLLCNQGSYDDAMARFHEALRVNPQYAEAHDGLGVALFQKGRADEAISEFETALRLKPGYADASSNLARAKKIKLTPAP